MRKLRTSLSLRGDHAQRLQARRDLAAAAAGGELELDPPAPQGDLDGMIEQFDAMLEGAGYFFPPDKVPTTKRMIRTLLTKPAWTAGEVRTVRGMLSALARPQKR